MTEEWYVTEDGQGVGPFPAEEIRRRVDIARGAPLLVWTDGMSEWVDARTLSQFASKPRAGVSPRATPEARKPETLKQRARHEFLAYLVISGYLMVWFSALMFYKATILRSVGVEFAPFGFAVIKALILGKFILVLEAVKLGEKDRGATLIMQIVKKAALFTVALIVMNAIEEIVVGHFHGRDAREALHELGGSNLPQAFAGGVLMFLVLVPYLAYRRLAQEFGELPELLFERRKLEQRK